MKGVPLGELIKPARAQRAGSEEHPILSMTMHDGLVDQSSKFKKRVASYDVSDYKVVERGQLVVGFPIDEGVLDFQTLYDTGIVSPAYGIWYLADSDRVDITYLKRFLRSNRAITYYKAKLRGSTARRRSLPTEFFLALPVPLPTVGEQRRIAAILDQADAIRAKRRQVLDHLDALAQSIFHDMFGDLRANGDFLDSVAEIQGGLQVSSKRADLPVEVPYLRVANVYRSWIQLDEVKKIRATRVEVERTRLQRGDLLFVEGHANPQEVGRVAVWDCEIPSCVHQNHVIRARLDTSKILPIFAAFWLNTARGAEHFRRASKTTSGLNTISAKTVRSAPLPRPIMNKQRKFVDKIEQVEAQRAVVQRALDADDELFASFQARAFRGEL